MILLKMGEILNFVWGGVASFNTPDIPLAMSLLMTAICFITGNTIFFSRSFYPATYSNIITSKH